LENDLSLELKDDELELEKEEAEEIVFELEVVHVKEEIEEVGDG
jgi:hypothetical protein